MQKQFCPSCNQQTITEEIVQDSIEYGLTEPYEIIFVDLPVNSCSNCGIQFVDEKGMLIQDEAVNNYLKKKD